MTENSCFNISTASTSNMDDAKENKLLNIVNYYKDAIQKNVKLGNDAKILNYISKLYEMPITVAHLQETGIGRTINSLRKYNGDVGNASRAIVSKWKEMVENEDENETENGSERSPDDKNNQESNDDSQDEQILDRKLHKERSSNHPEVNNHRNVEGERDKHKKKSKHDKKRKHRDSDSHRSKRKKHDSPDESEQEEVGHAEDSDDSKYQKPAQKEMKEHSRHKHHKSDRQDERKQEKKHKSSHKHENGHKKTEKSDKSKSPKKEMKSVSKVKACDNDGIDSGSGTSFAEALGMMEPSTSRNNFKKKNSNTSTHTSPPVSKSKVQSPQKSQSPVTQSLNLLTQSVKLEPLDINISTVIPEITTNYKPLSYYNYDVNPSVLNSKLSEEEALSRVISSKSQRTKVYSGNKSNCGYVPSLFHLCVKVLQENIEFLEYTGGVPYQILKPVLEKATADQLHMAEQYNPYLLDDSDELWEAHCKRHFRNKQREEMESWRDMYMRCLDERESKLKALTANIKQSIDKSLPVRQTKLAYVDSVVKPPRAIARKQAKYGTDKKPMSTPMTKLNSIVSSASVGSVTVPNPGARAASSSASGSSFKPKKAPLMQKTLALIKNRYRR